ncbi:MAG: hypothetical protein ACOX2Q_10440 [Dehalobacterium sp.]
MKDHKNHIGHKMASFISRWLAVIFVRVFFLGRKSVAVIFEKNFGLPILIESIELWDGIGVISDQREEKFSRVQTIFKAKARGPEQVLYIGRGPPTNFYLGTDITFH